MTSIVWTLPIRPLRTSSQPKRQCGERSAACVPYWKMRLLLLEDLAAGEVLLDGHGQRLLHVGVLLRPGGGDGHRHVPMVGRGDHHGVDVLAGQQLAEIAVGLALDHPRVGFAAVLVGVGHRHALQPLHC